MASFFDPSQARPDWLKPLSQAEFSQKLRSRAFRDQVMGYVNLGKFKIRMMHPLTDPYWMDCIVVVRCADASYVGRTIGEIARERAPQRILDAVYRESYETVFDILAEDPEATCADFIDKREYRALPTFLKHPVGMPCTDVGAMPAQPAARSGMRQ